MKLRDTCVPPPVLAAAEQPGAHLRRVVRRVPTPFELDARRARSRSASATARTCLARDCASRTRLSRCRSASTGRRASADSRGGSATCANVPGQSHDARGSAASDQIRSRRARRSAGAVPGPLAQEAPSQAPAHSAALRGTRGFTPRERRSRLRLATDWEPYALQMLEVLISRAGNVPQSLAGGDWMPRLR